MKTLIEFRQKKQNKVGFGEIKCNVCSEPLWKSSPTHKYHGSEKEKGSCAHIAALFRWREGFNKRKSANPEKYKQMVKEWLAKHPGYMQEYGKKYRNKSP